MARPQDTTRDRSTPYVQQHPRLVACWRAQWSGPWKNVVDSIFALVAWEFWEERNARCFHGTVTQMPELLLVIKHQAELWVQTGAKNLGLLQRVIS